MENERRRKERVTTAQQPKGKFYLYVGDQCHDVRAVVDVSPFGVGLHIDNAINNGTDIHLKYQHETIEIEVNGSVVWSRIVKQTLPSIYLLGISLRPEDVETNIQFFRSVSGQT
jgi:Flp pilus assembly secretin CpaC